MKKGKNISTDNNNLSDDELLQNMTNITCKMIIAELELFREEINKFIDDFIEKQINEMK